MATQADASDTKQSPQHGEIAVTVAAPNNAQREMTFDVHDRVDKIAREAVKVFVNAGQMTQMDCSVAVVLDGVATRLDDAFRLSETPVRPGMRIVLIPKTPKTDG